MKTDKKYTATDNTPPKAGEAARAYADAASHASQQPLSHFSAKEQAFLEQLFDEEAAVFKALAK